MVLSRPQIKDLVAQLLQLDQNLQFEFSNEEGLSATIFALTPCQYEFAGGLLTDNPEGDDLDDAVDHDDVPVKLDKPVIRIDLDFESNVL